MDYDQALRIACFYGMVQEVESLLWMEAEPDAIALNKRDRGTEFHLNVSPIIRDGIKELVSEAMKEREGTSNGSPREGGGVSESRAVIAAKEAAAAWGGCACASPTGTLDQSETSSFTSADTSTASRDCWSAESGDGDNSSTMTAGEMLDKPQRIDRCGLDETADGRRGCTYGKADLKDSLCNDDNDDDDDEDAFVVPVLSSLENDLLREGVTEEAPVGAAAVMKRWGQRVRGVTLAATTSPTTRAAAAAGGGEGSPKRPGAGAGLGVKDRARATFAGVMKWATSPPRRTRVVAGC